MAYYNNKKIVFSPHYHSAFESETIPIRISIDPESQGEFVGFDVYGTKIDNHGAPIQYHSGMNGDKLQGDFLKNTPLVIKKSNDLTENYSDLPIFYNGDNLLSYFVDDRLSPLNTNALKLINGTYNLTGRTIVVANGEAVCNAISALSSTIIIPNAALDSTYDLMAGSYYFSAGIVSQSSSLLTSPFIRLIGNNETTYDFNEGLFELPVPARVDSIRNGSTILFSDGSSYTIQPKITLARLEIELIAE